ncbi:hypothetical protein ACCO45_006235 [Purpureocillium lilacinum]|uniref:Uncharacterized protein n=1 Tax=Purpureocillium lilacinum TaxID=33203 RepID=A0ACC4E0P8_PURLI
MIAYGVQALPLSFLPLLPLVLPLAIPGLVLALALTRACTVTWATPEWAWHQHISCHSSSPVHLTIRGDSLERAGRQDAKRSFVLGNT